MRSLQGDEGHHRHFELVVSLSTMLIVNSHQESFSRLDCNQYQGDFPFSS
jgi:hypothetical protein